MRVGRSAKVTATPTSAVGRISSIGYAASYSGGLATFPVVVSLPVVSGLRPGMAVQPMINVKQVTDGYVLPLETCHRRREIACQRRDDCRGAGDASPHVP